MAEKNKSSYKFNLGQQATITSSILSYTKPYIIHFIIAVALTLGSSSLSAYLPIVVRNYIDFELTSGNVTLNIAFRFMLWYFFLTIVQLILMFFSQWLFSYAAELTVSNLRNRAYEKISGLGMSFYDQTPVGTVVSRVTNDTESIKEFFRVVLSFIQGVFSIGTILFAMWQLDHRLSFYFALFLPVMIMLIYLYQRYSSQIYSDMRAYLSRINANLNESIVGIAIIQHFRQENRKRQEFAEINDAYFKERRKIFSIDALLLRPAMSLLEGLALSLIIYYFGRASFDMAVDVGIIYAFTNYTKSFFQPMTQMMDSLSVFQDGLVSGSRIFKLMEDDRTAPDQAAKPGLEINQAEIEFKNVSFSYDGEHDVLKNISFHVQPGETVAFVGTTGSGKSSIMNVLMRFYEFHSGQILVDGKPIRDYPIQELREKFGLVLQDSFLFYGNIANNIRMYDDQITIQEVVEAAEFVQADGFIEKLEGGYQAKVYERGSTFSAGEKQLISFARIMARKPKLLILDEATANIDTETEEQIQESLGKMTEGRTTIAIAHRLSTIRNANQIIVLDKGEIIEQGNHDELIELGGQYYRMYQLQALNESIEEE